MKMHVDYDWSLRALEKAPDNEECDAGMPIMIGMDIAGGPDSTVYACREHINTPHPACPVCAEVARLTRPQEANP